MRPWPKGLIFFILIFWPLIAIAQPLSPEAQKIRSQADDLEDKSAQAIDDGNLEEASDLMFQAVQLDPTPLRFMNYGSILFGNGVSAFKEDDQVKGIAILKQAEVQLHKAIEGFNPNKDQVYLSQCYFLLGEMYLNAFDEKVKAIEYYQKSADLSDYSGAKDALNKLSSSL